MATEAIYTKSLGGAEDLLLDASNSPTVIQTRAGKELEITKINSSTIPYSGKFGDPSMVSIKDQLDIKANTVSSAYVIETIDDFGTVPSGIDTVIVKDINRGGTFIYDATKSAVNNGGTVFDGWVRQYSGAVNVKWFGDDIQAALSICGNIELNTNTIYTLSSTITYDGTVNIIGNNAIIKSDIIAFSIYNGSNSNIKDIQFQPITTPYTVIRGANFAPTLGYSLDGYQPTVNDSDIWNGLTTQQKNQNIGSGIIFNEASTIQSNITISGISGNFVSIILKATEDSTVKNCNFKAGKNFAGGILFWSLDALAGRRNKVIDCTVKTASYSGIVFANQYDGQVSNCNCSFNGESGIKTWQGVTGDTNKTAHGMLISNNICYSNFYDGLDVQATYGDYDATYDNRNSIIGNTSWFNNKTGIVVNGSFNIVTDNIFRSNGTGGIVANDTTNSTFKGNISYNNNTTEQVAGYHQIAINGNGNYISNNDAGKFSTVNGYNYYITGDTTTIFAMNEQMNGENLVYLSGVRNRSRTGFLNISDSGFTSFDTAYTDLDDIRTTSIRLSNSDSNRPDGNWYYVFTMGSGYMVVQLAFSFVNGPSYRRIYNDAVWSSWVAI